MARHIFIVARAHRDLFEFLEKQFAEDGNVWVVLDRRQSDRRRAYPTHSAHDGDRRRAVSDRRTRPAVDEELKARSHAIITLPT